MFHFNWLPCMFNENEIYGQLYNEVARFDLNFIWNSEILKEWYFQEKMSICQETPK